MRQPLTGKIPQNELETVQFFLQSSDRGLIEVGEKLAKEWRIGDAKRRPPTADCHQNTATAAAASQLPVALLLRLSEIITLQGDFKRGANATIAEVVFGDRSLTGGSYNATIQAIKKRLQEAFNLGYL